MTTTRLDGVLKTGGRDLNTTGFELKSIGESEGRGRPVSFKEPPKLGTGAPTAAALKKLDTKSFGARSDAGGPKSARSHALSVVSRVSAEPANPYKDHTVEQMDVLIEAVAKEIQICNMKLRVIDKDAYATKTTI